MNIVNNVIKTLKEIYSNASVPIVITDTELLVIWSNQCAVDAYPRFKVPDGLVSMLAIFSAENVFKMISDNKTLNNPKNINIPIPLSLEMISLTPIKEQDSFVGYIVNFKLDNSPGNGIKPNGSQRLISAFSHEFRSPLTRIFSSLSALSRSIDYEEQPDLKNLINEINQNCYKMFKTSVNIVDYIKYIHPNNELELVNINISKFVKGLADAIRIVASTAGTEIFCEIEDSDLNLACDVKKISTAILHLVNNSLVFGYLENSITLSMKVLSNNVLFSISDKGLGIPDNILPHVFEPFFSYDHLGRPFAGAGLGLAITKSIVTLHGGTIAINSEIDKGTTVSFTIPINENDDISLAEPKAAADYLLDSFSNVYVMLSDVCKCPNP